MNKNGTKAPPPLDIFASDLLPMQHWYTKAKERTERWKTGIPEGRATGFRAIDHYTRLIDGELTIIAGRPSMGKSSIGMQMVYNMATQLEKSQEDGVVAVFSAEMPGWSMFLRLASIVAGVNISDLAKGKRDPLAERKLEEIMDHLRTMPIWIDEGAAPTTEVILARLSELNAAIRVKGMLFDFMELGGNRAQSEELRVSGIAMALKGIAKALGIPVIALSQLNRKVEDRANRMPGLSDLRQSGMLEQIADVVILLMRPEYYIERGISVAECPPEDEKGVAYAQVVKNRNGPVGRANLAFDSQYARFANLQRQAVNMNP